MEQPPFRPALLPAAVTSVGGNPVPFDGDEGLATGSRLRLGEMDPHLHCSVIGTCLSAADLRKLMARFIDVHQASDLDVHHEAVRLAGQHAEVARNLHKALDRQHDVTVRRFAAAKDANTLAGLWAESLKAGDVAGAYWAVLTHRRTSADLRQQAFGEVHMLSHLMGAANRADIRRLVAMERDNAELRERADRQDLRLAEILRERDAAQQEGADLRIRVLELERLAKVPEREQDVSLVTGEAQMQAVAVQTRRRELAETRASTLAGEVARLQDELDHARAHGTVLARELAAAEAELRRDMAPAPAATAQVAPALSGRKLLYVGGRPSSSEAVRGFAARLGAEYRHHDGGIEDRKGLLAAALAWADIVAFPVDCIDHDSAQSLKKACLQRGTQFLALRTASVASLAAAVSALAQPGETNPTCFGPCRHHG